MAFTAFGAPAWAEPGPNVPDRPPLDARKAQRSDAPSPPVADTGDLDRDAKVAPFDKAHSREYFAVLPDSVPKKSLEKVDGLSGVQATEVVDAAQVKVDGEDTSMLGVDPSRFRGFAPKPSAKSDEVWQGIADGRVALSDEVGTQRDLDVGSDVDIAGSKGKVSREVWTHATSGVAGIDALVSRETADELGFPEGNGLVVSAPDADVWKLRDDLKEALGKDASLQLLDEDPPPRPADKAGEAVGEGTTEEMIAAAESQKGVPYVWGGETPKGGFDCSGLVQWAYGRSGVQVPRVAHDQWYAGQRVDFSDAQRGDLLFWRSDPTAPDYISHVAIYLGDERMLEAPRTGKDVQVSPVRTENAAGAVRVRTGA